ncbi:PRC-barrel domain-containing protein [Mobiluncus curtisii]|uniref:PRC-barrel domain-containing protein n=1 Tax=Mobiluncus curtisii TaxID=2051 RepID=UPI00147084C6|nr:ribosome maturation factor RimM [Mobiluncus curtisii]
MKLTVGIIGRASGVRGEVRVALRTDDPRSRFAPGTVLLTNRNSPAALTVDQPRMSGKHFVVSFQEIPDRNGAETLSGTKLYIETDAPPLCADPGDTSDTTADPEVTDYPENTEGDDGFYRHELVGLRAMNLAGETLGTISDLLLAPAQDLLEVTTAEGEKILVPFVYEIVPDVDLDNGLVTMDPPGGLFPSH